MNGFNRYHGFIITFWILVSVPGAAFSCFSQSVVPRNYVIIACEVLNSKSFEGVQRTFWIVEQDSILSKGTVFSPLLLSGYYKNDLDSCCAGRGFDPYVSDPTSEKQLDSIKGRALNSLYSLISKKKKIIQSYKRELSGGADLKIIFYAIPVVGVFCSSHFSFTGLKRTDYSGEVYLPYSDFKEDVNFWRNAQSKLLKQLNLSVYNFNYNITYNVFPEWVKFRR